MPSSADSIPLVSLAALQGWKVAGSRWASCPPFLLPLPHPTALDHALLHPCITRSGRDMVLLKGEEPMRSAHRTFGIPLTPGAALRWDQGYRAHSQTKGSPALAPGSGRALQCDAIPRDNQSSPQHPGAQRGSYLERGASRAWGWAASSPLPSGLLHPPTPRSGTRCGHEVLPHVGIGLHVLSDRR